MILGMLGIKPLQQYKLVYDIDITIIPSVLYTLGYPLYTIPMIYVRAPTFLNKLPSILAYHPGLGAEAAYSISASNAILSSHFDRW